MCVCVRVRLHMCVRLGVSVCEQGVRMWAQGELVLWDAAMSSWHAGHAVLTRAGFLHWFASPDDPAPKDTLALARWGGRGCGRVDCGEAGVGAGGAVALGQEGVL